MLAFLTPIWNNPLTRKIAMWAGILIALYFGYRTWKAGIENGVKRQEKVARERDNAIEQTKVVQTQQSIERTLNDHATKADAARADLPAFGSAAELQNSRPDLASLVLPVGTGDR